MEELAIREKSPYERILEEYCKILDEMRGKDEVSVTIRIADIRLWMVDAADEFGWEKQTKYAIEDEFFPIFDASNQTVNDYLDILALAPLRLLAERQYPEIGKVDAYSIEKIMTIASDYGSKTHGAKCIGRHPEFSQSEAVCSTSYSCPARQIVSDLYEVASYIMLHENVAISEFDTIQAARMRQTLQVIENCMVKGEVCSSEDFREFVASERKIVARFMNPESYSV